MKLFPLAVVAICAAIAGANAAKCPGASAPVDSPAEPETLLLDPQSVDAAEIDDLRMAGKKTLCLASTLELVQLCRDKGFDSVTFATETPQLLEQAKMLRLAVVGSEGRRTTNGS